MQRTLLGLLTAFILLATGGLWLLMPESSGKATLVGTGLRLGIILGVVWLALPNVFGLFQRFPAWLMGTTLLGIVLMLVRPRLAPILAPILIALWVLAPHWLEKRREP